MTCAGRFTSRELPGSKIKIHVTFFLLLAWIGFGYHRAGGVPAAIDGLLFVILIFVCILLHELEHALAAARYGIKTPDINLLPIGGVACVARAANELRAGHSDRGQHWTGIAFVFFILGLWSNSMLLLIAVFVYFGASSEAVMAQMRSISRDLRVSAAMVTQFQSLPENATSNEAVEELLRTSQHEFPITASDGRACAAS